jgi:RHS repeat-associated protein
VTQDRAALEEALGHAPYDGGTGAVDPKLRAWRALANITGMPPPAVGAGPAAWTPWANTQRTAFNSGMLGVPQTEKWADRFGNLPLYASYWWDARVGVYHVRHRVLDPESGRWLQRDPIGYAGGSNLYGYIGDVPHFGVDPMGLSPLGDYFDNFVGGASELIDVVTGAAKAEDAAWVERMRGQRSVSEESRRYAETALRELRQEEGRHIARTAVAAVLAVATLNPAVVAVGSGTAFGGGLGGAIAGGAGMGALFDLASQTVELAAGYSDSFSWTSLVSNTALGATGGAAASMLGHAIGLASRPTSPKTITQRLQEIVDEVKLDFKANPSKYLTANQSRDMARAAAHRGTAIDEAVKRRVDNDSVLRELVDINPRFVRGADFVAKDGSGRWWDMTTSKQWAKGAHCKKYGPGGTHLNTD